MFLLLLCLTATLESADQLRLHHVAAQILLYRLGSCCLMTTQLLQDLLVCAGNSVAAALANAWLEQENACNHQVKAYVIVASTSQCVRISC